MNEKAPNSRPLPELSREIADELIALADDPNSAITSELRESIVSRRFVIVPEVDGIDS